jgi:hypothetical protein
MTCNDYNSSRSRKCCVVPKKCVSSFQKWLGSVQFSLFFFGSWNYRKKWISLKLTTSHDKPCLAKRAALALGGIKSWGWAAATAVWSCWPSMPRPDHDGSGCCSFGYHMISLHIYILMKISIDITIGIFRWHIWNMVCFLVWSRVVHMERKYMILLWYMVYG